MYNIDCVICTYTFECCDEVVLLAVGTSSSAMIFICADVYSCLTSKGTQSRTNVYRRDSIPLKKDCG